MLTDVSIMSDLIDIQESGEVNLSIDDGDHGNQNEDITQRLRSFTLSRLAGVLSPLVRLIFEYCVYFFISTS